jgi:DNA-binding transcriptional regulator YiaG
MKKKRNKNTEHLGLTDAEERDLMIATAYTDTDDTMEKARVLEARPILPRGKKAVLNYENKPQRVSRGRMLKYLRENLNLTQREFAALLGTNRSYIGQAEKGIVNISCAALDLWCSKAGGRLMIIPF